VIQEWILLGLRILAVAALYAFLWVVLRGVWRDLRSTALLVSRRQDAGQSIRDGLSARSWLQIVVPGDVQTGVGERLPLLPTTTIGRSGDNVLVVQDESVSAFHARLDFTDNEWLLTDLDSRNGTRLNDIPISSTVPLANGDLISFGQVIVRYVQENHEPEAIESFSESP
jgi:hypothetical protein